MEPSPSWLAAFGTCIVAVFLEAEACPVPTFSKEPLVEDTGHMAVTMCNRLAVWNATIWAAAIQ